MKSQSLVGALLILFAAPAFAGSIYNQLSDDQKSQLQQGQQVTAKEDVSGSAWPKVTVYQLVASTPEQAAAVFFDFAKDADYQPNVEKCEIAKQVDGHTLDVDYTVKIKAGFFDRDDNFSVEDTLSQYDGKSSYRVDWHMLSADSAKDIEGFGAFEPVGTQTLVVYYNFVNPDQWGAGLVKGRFVDSVRNTVSALANRIGQERSGQLNDLQAETVQLRTALGE